MFFFFDSKVHVAVIGDIVQSRKIVNRTEVQSKLKALLAGINEKYNDDIASKFMITLGDEFQGLLQCGQNAMKIIEEIEMKMYPIQLRFGIGIGKITTEIDFEQPLGSDGPAYYNARDMINELKKNEKKKKMPDADIMIASEGDNESTDILLNSILSLCTVIKKNWTARQREVINVCSEYGDNQQEVALLLGITQSSVQKNLSNANYYSFKNAISTVSKAMMEIKRSNENQESNENHESNEKQ